MKLHRTPPLVGFALLTACNTPQPQIQIIEPAEGTVLTATDTLTVTVATTDFTLSEDGIGQTNVEGEGHWHLILDDDQKLATTAANSVSVDLSTLELTPQLHTLRVELFNNDHSPLEEPAFDTVEIQIQ